MPATAMPSELSDTSSPTVPIGRSRLVVKRIFDVVLSLLCLILFSPVLLLAAIAVKLTSRGPVFYRQQRVGKNFKLFWIFKFRSMSFQADKSGVLITAGHDPRITAVGHFLRKSKIDELPQLFNVLRGEMSLVGPRPEVSKYVEMFRAEYAELLSVRPGITDLASVEYRDESEILGQSDDPERDYTQIILPKKIAIAREYLKHVSISYDLWIIGRTIRKIFS